MEKVFEMPASVPSELYLRGIYGADVFIRFTSSTEVRVAFDETQRAFSNIVVLQEPDANCVTIRRDTSIRRSEVKSPPSKEVNIQATNGQVIVAAGGKVSGVVVNGSQVLPSKTSSSRPVIEVWAPNGTKIDAFQVSRLITTGGMGNHLFIQQSDAEVIAPDGGIFTAVDNSTIAITNVTGSVTEHHDETSTVTIGK